MKYNIINETGLPLEANLELDDGFATLQSRGGTLGSRNEQNRDYSEALRLILRRIKEAPNCGFHEIIVDSRRVQNLPHRDRIVLSKSEAREDSSALFTLISRRSQNVGRAPDAKSKKGNSNKRLRICFPEKNSEEIAQILGLMKSTAQDHINTRLSPSQMQQVSAEHIHLAIINILNGKNTSRFQDSTIYDLIIEGGQRLPPKAVFGLAATMALGFEVLPEHFEAGEKNRCYKILRSCGYDIVPKNAEPSTTPELTNDDRLWAEGNIRLVTHLRKERARGAAAAKKAEFYRLHGRLFCEKCGLDPVQAFGGIEGEACIEVHHATTSVENMSATHQTALSDLQCLCANCHRYVHRVMKTQKS